MKRVAPFMKLEFGSFKAEGLGNVGVFGVVLALAFILIFGMLAGPQVIRGLFFLTPDFMATGHSASSTSSNVALKHDGRAAQSRNARGPGEALSPTKILQHG